MNFQQNNNFNFQQNNNLRNTVNPNNNFDIPKDNTVGNYLNPKLNSFQPNFPNINKINTNLKNLNIPAFDEHHEQNFGNNSNIINNNFSYAINQKNNTNNLPTQNQLNYNKNDIIFSSERANTQNPNQSPNTNLIQNPNNNNNLMNNFQANNINNILLKNKLQKKTLTPYIDPNQLNFSNNNPNFYPNNINNNNSIPQENLGNINNNIYQSQTGKNNNLNFNSLNNNLIFSNNNINNNQGITNKNFPHNQQSMKNLSSSNTIYFPNIIKQNNLNSSETNNITQNFNFKDTNK